MRLPHCLLATSVASIVVAAFQSPVQAIVVHPSTTPTQAVVGGPNPNVVGKFSGASAVAIAPNYFLSSAHQGIGNAAQFGNTWYEAIPVATFTTSVDTDNNSIPETYTADLALYRLEILNTDDPANLTDYTPILDEAAQVEEFVMAGWGQGRGTNVTQGPNTIGYNWDGVNLTTERYGTNRIENTQFVSSANPVRITATLRADFDGPSGGTGNTTYEAATAGGDSGSGWFVQRNNQWFLTGIAIAVENPGQSLFNEQPPFSSGDIAQDYLWAAHMAYYAEQINAAIPEPGTAVLLLGAVPLLLHRRVQRRGA